MTALSDLVSIDTMLPFNVGLKSARAETMISCLGRPLEPLTYDDQPDHASSTVKALLVQDTIGNVRAHGIRPAVDSLKQILGAAFAETPELKDVLRGNGMMVVRLRRPTSGEISKDPSNHSWGTAIDFNLAGQPSPGNTKNQVPEFIRLLTPHFNKAGWYSGVAFHDDMHFEVADGTIHQWADEGRFKV